MDSRFKPVLMGIIFGLLTLLSAEFMASSFGIYEDDIKGALLQEALEHTEGARAEREILWRARCTCCEDHLDER